MSWLLLRKIGTEKGKREEGRGKKKDREREEGTPLEQNDEAVPLFPFPSSLLSLCYGSPGHGPTTPGAAHSMLVSSATVSVWPAGTRRTPFRSLMGPAKGSNATGFFDICAMRRCTRS